MAEELLEGRTDFLAGVEADVPEGWTTLLTGMETDIPEKWAVFLAGAEEKLPGMIRERFTGLNEESFRKENAGRFYETLSRTKRMARTVMRPTEKVRTPLVRQETTETRPGEDARWLDRIFQRDARRYDGGFTWQ